MQLRPVNYALRSQSNLVILPALPHMDSRVLLILTGLRIQRMGSNPTHIHRISLGSTSSSSEDKTVVPMQNGATG